MRGFLDTYINGIRMWEKEEYERWNGDKSEAERLGDMLGYPGAQDLHAMKRKAWATDERLLYHMEDTAIDRRLYTSVPEIWSRYGAGYVHNITGEYVRGSKPHRDSSPAWVKVPLLEDDPFAVHGYGESIHASDVGEIFLGLAGIIEMLKRSKE